MQVAWENHIWSHLRLLSPTPFNVDSGLAFPVIVSCPKDFIIGPVCLTKETLLMFINKLHHLGIRQQLGGWIQDFFTPQVSECYVRGLKYLPLSGLRLESHRNPSWDPFCLYFLQMISNTVFLLVLQCTLTSLDLLSLTKSCITISTW